MLDGNTFGRAAHESRTINVEANLLSERLLERERVSEVARKKVALIVGVLVLAAFSLPPAYRLQSVATQRAVDAERRAAVFAANLADLEKEKQAIQPKVAVDEMRKVAESQSERFLGQISLMLNAVPSNVALRVLHSEVLGGDMRIAGQAEAEDYAAARAFIEEAKKGPDVDDMALSSTRRSDSLGEAGVAFEFAKKVVMGK